MGMVVCSISRLKEKHELAKKYNCYSKFIAEQSRILDEVEKNTTAGDDETCLESYEYAIFNLIKEPKEVVMDLINQFGEKVICDTIKTITSEKITKD